MSASSGDSSVPKPRCGGVITVGGTQIAWTGGGEADNKRAAPASSSAYRPADLRGLTKLEETLKAGLPEEYRLDEPEETRKDSFKGTGFTSWLKHVRKAMMQTGMDSVFRITDSSGAQTCNLLEEWGQQTLAQVKAWVQRLQQGADQYDLYNLEFSMNFLQRSITTQMWTRIEADANAVETGPELFAIIIRAHQVTSVSAIRSLTMELAALSLKKVPGENVEVMCDKVTMICDKIEGIGDAPTDLSTLVSEIFMDCSTSVFESAANDIYKKCDSATTSMSRGSQAMPWRQILQEHKQMYRRLLARGNWKAAAKTKAEVTDLGAMQAEISRQVTQQLKAKFPGKQGGGDGKKPAKDLSRVKCFKCGKMGHLRRDCPDKGSDGGNGGSGKTKPWFRIGPKNGEAEVKTKDGKEYKWCGKCKSWRSNRGAHTTSEHRTRSDNQTSGEQSQANQAELLSHTNPLVLQGHLAVLGDPSQTKDQLMSESLNF